MMPRTGSAFLALVLVAVPQADAAIYLTEKKGDVAVKSLKGAKPLAAVVLPYELETDDEVKAGPDSRARVVFDDGAQVEVFPGTTFSLGKSNDTQVVNLAAGRVKSWVQGGLRNRFQVKTPIAVAAVRGTEFDVAFGTDMEVEVFDGLIGVRDLLGNEVLVASGERLRVIPGRPLDRPERIDGRVAPDPKTEIKREVSLGMSKDAVQAAAAMEARLAEYQEGKTMIDVSGARVRLEEYIVRPAADTFKLVALNERDDRFDYFYYQGKFNTTLPTDLSVALKDVNGKTGNTPPAYYLTEYESGRSNTTDTILENGAGGHLNQSTLTENKTVYHADTDSFETVASGSTLWETLFDNYSYKVNNTEWYGWQPLSGSGITAYDYTQFQTRIAGSLLGTGGSATIACSGQSDCVAKENLLRVSEITKPDGQDILHDKVTLEYKAALAGPVVYSETYDFYTTDDTGKIATNADFSGVLSGESYLDTLLRFNYQQVIQSSSFNGRTIDLVLEPKILIRSGLLQ